MRRASVLAVMLLFAFNAYAFHAFDATQFRTAHPTIGPRLAVASECELMGQCDNTDRAPVEATIKARLARYAGAPALVLDFESWYPLKDKRLVANAARNAAWYALVLRWAREALPGTRLGFFGFPILARYAYSWPADYMGDYMAAHRLLLPVMNASDALYPEFYLWFREPALYSFQSWTVTLGRMLGKPVIPFMWHKDPRAVTADLPDAELAAQCAFLRTNADGVAWWSKWSEVYDPASSWATSAARCFN